MGFPAVSAESGPTQASLTDRIMLFGPWALETSKGSIGHCGTGTDSVGEQQNQ